MNKPTVFLVLALLVSSLACQSLISSGGGTVIADCAEIVSAVSRLQPPDIPNHLIESGQKRGDEFDANQYFGALPHLSMHEGYTLDYVYQSDDLGGYPLLYARPADQPPYTSIADVPEPLQSADFREYVDVEDVEAGYFEYVVLDLMASQFYLSWHANYNDTEIVCDRAEVNTIVEQVSSGDFGYPMGPVAQLRARLMREIEPRVTLSGDVATVRLITFTKWGGFYRVTYTINRGTPHTILDAQYENLVPYDCGVMF